MILATWPTVDQLFRRHACKKDVHEEMKFRTTRFNLTCIAFLHVTLQTLLKRKLEDSSFLIFCWSVSIPVLFQSSFTRCTFFDSEKNKFNSQTNTFSCNTSITYYIVPTHRIHVWYIYLHIPYI